MCLSDVCILLCIFIIQHIREDGTPVHYFVSGAGNFVDKSLEHINDLPPNSLKYHWADYFGLGAFASLKINSTSAVVSYYTGGGKLVKVHDPLLNSGTLNCSTCEQNS